MLFTQLASAFVQITFLTSCLAMAVPSIPETTGAEVPAFAEALAVAEAPASATYALKQATRNEVVKSSKTGAKKRMTSGVPLSSYALFEGYSFGGIEIAGNSEAGSVGVTQCGTLCSLNSECTYFRYDTSFDADGCHLRKILQNGIAHNGVESAFKGETCATALAKYDFLKDYPCTTEKY